jgi:hypothetical protein
MKMNVKTLRGMYFLTVPFFYKTGILCYLIGREEKNEKTNRGKRIK